MKWNDIPYDGSVDPEVKGLQFDLQIEENGGDSSVTHNFAYEEEDDEGAENVGV